jgi:hypothetical protein
MFSASFCCEAAYNRVEFVLDSGGSERAFRRLSRNRNSSRTPARGLDRRTRSCHPLFSASPQAPNPRPTSKGDFPYPVFAHALWLGDLKREAGLDRLVELSQQRFPLPWPAEASCTANPTDNCAQRRSDVSYRLGRRSTMEIPVTTQEVANGKHS